MSSGWGDVTQQSPVPHLHTHTHRQTTHVRPQIGAKDEVQTVIVSDASDASSSREDFVIIHGTRTRTATKHKTGTHRENHIVDSPTC